jgi:hypothetical protein
VELVPSPVGVLLPPPPLPLLGVVVVPLPPLPVPLLGVVVVPLLPVPLVLPEPLSLPELPPVPLPLVSPEPELGGLVDPEPERELPREPEPGSLPETLEAGGAGLIGAVNATGGPPYEFVVGVGPRGNRYRCGCRACPGGVGCDEPRRTAGLGAAARGSCATFSDRGVTACVAPGMGPTPNAGDDAPALDCNGAAGPCWTSPTCAEPCRPGAPGR